MISPRKVCFVYFALLFGMAHAEATNTTTPSDSTEDTTSKTNNIDTTSEKTTIQSSAAQTSTTVSTQPTAKPEQKHCIFYLPTDGYTLVLIVAALTLGCLALLLITLICGCQVCHLRGIISSLQPRYDNTDRHARREKSESPCQEEGQEDRHPTETCFMLSEVTTAQEESREDQENKTEEEYDTEQPSTVNDQNGDIAQENSPEPDAKAPESYDTGV